MAQGVPSDTWLRSGEGYMAQGVPSDLFAHLVLLV